MHLEVLDCFTLFAMTSTFAMTLNSASHYTGRFAPSPTGALHAGSLVAALASWLDARAHGGQWLVRIEDVDSTRCLPGIDQTILQQLAACGLHSDQPPLYQSRRPALYQRALDQLIASGHAYPCGCSRRDIELAGQNRGQLRARHGELIYPGTCRDGLHGKPARAWRFRTGGQSLVRWQDRRLGAQAQDVSAAVGDFILKRADGCFAYQLAVVVDDADQGVTDVVRGEDLADNTARQILLQRALGVATPRYLHTPLVLGNNGEKLSKQNGARALDTRHPLATLNRAAAVLGMAPQHEAADALAHWVAQWKCLYNRAP
jgi:glutamyl-Q tRNA(Asp) synthetase